MAVTVTDPVAGPFYPNGVTVSFPFSFKVMSADEIALIDADGQELSGFSYSVTVNAGEGGAVVFSSAPTAAALPSFSIASDPSFAQSSQFGATSTFNPATLQAPLDREAVKSIYLREKIGRSVRVPVGEEGYLIPSVADRAGKLMGWLAGSGSPIAVAYSAIADFIIPLLPDGPKGDPGSPGEGYPTRSAIAGLTATAGDDAYLAEGLRAGRFIFDASNRSARVTADPLQGVNIAPASDPTGASGAWVREEKDLCPDFFGALGDNTTDDTAAFGALSNYINARATAAIVSLRPGAIYRVGTQILQNPPIYTYYNFPPVVVYPVYANNLPAFRLKGNAATIRTVDGAKYGTFNNDGTKLTTSPGYVGPGASTPYYQMVRVNNCRSVHIDFLELDGNIANTNIGGFFSDTGIQLQMTGYDIADCSGPMLVEGVYTHHHGLDGGEVFGKALSASAPREGGTLLSCRHEYNGRQGLSITGGKGWSAIDCTFSHTGRATGVGGAIVASNPGSGIDLEAEGGHFIRNWFFLNCEFNNNINTGIVADSGTNTRGVTFDTCTFVGTTNYSIWPNRPRFRFRNCLIVGTAVQLWSDAANPGDSVQFDQCEFSDDVALSPSGTVFQNNGLLFEGGVRGHVFDRCTFRKTKVTNGGGGNANGPLYIDCSAIAEAGTLSIYGRWQGSDNLFSEVGAGQVAVPGGIIAGRNDAGPASSSWVYRSGGVNGTYGATIDVSGNILKYQYTGYDGDATLTTGVDQMTWIAIGPLTADRAWTLSDTGARVGSKFRISRTTASTGAFNLNIKTVGGTTLKALATGQDGIFEFINATQGWVLTTA